MGRRQRLHVHMHMGREFHADWSGLRLSLRMSRWGGGRPYLPNLGPCTLATREIIYGKAVKRFDFKL